MLLGRPLGTRRPLLVGQLFHRLEEWAEILMVLLTPEFPWCPIVVALKPTFVV